MNSSTSEMSRFVRFAAVWGKNYLSHGGPQSRLEERLAQAGDCYGFRTEVYASPTGLVVSARGDADTDAITRLEKVRDGSIRLAELKRLERLLDGLVNKKSDLRLAIWELESESTLQKREYPQWLGSLSILVLGFSSSLARYGFWKPAMGSGIITFLTWIVSQKMSARWKASGVFCDFVASVLALAMAQAGSEWFSWPAEELAIGTFILRVPGLTLTTAITELADHEFISGTVKLIKGALTLLALGTAYALVQECGAIGEISGHFQKAVYSAYDFKVVLGSVLTLASFSIVFEVPREALLGSIACGFAGWWILQLFSNPALFVVASFLASLIVGCISLGLGRIYRLPSQTFSVPGILTLVPGLLALSSFRSIAAGQGSQGTELALRVALIGVSIAFGIFTARVGAQRIKPSGHLSY